MYNYQLTIENVEKAAKTTFSTFLEATVITPHIP